MDSHCVSNSIIAIGILLRGKRKFGNEKIDAVTNNEFNNVKSPKLSLPYGQCHGFSSEWSSSISEG